MITGLRTAKFLTPEGKYSIRLWMSIELLINEIETLSLLDIADFSSKVENKDISFLPDMFFVKIRISNWTPHQKLRTIQTLLKWMKQIPNLSNPFHVSISMVMSLKFSYMKWMILEN